MDFILYALIVIYMGSLIYCYMNVQANILLRKELFKDREILEKRIKYIEEAEVLFSKAQAEHHEQVAKAFKGINEHQAKPDDNWVISYEPKVKPKKKAKKK